MLNLRKCFTGKFPSEYIVVPLVSMYYFVFPKLPLNHDNKSLDVPYTLEEVLTHCCFLYLFHLLDEEALH